MTQSQRESGTPAYGAALAVVTVTFSPGETLERFLDTLAKATTRKVSVVIVDNGSDDGAPELAARRQGVRLVRLGANIGYGAAANRGISELDDSFGWVVVANPDIEWEPNSLDTLLDSAHRWPDGGAFGPLIKDPDGTVYPSARLLPSMGRGVGHALFGRLWPRNPWTRAYRQEIGEPAEREAGWLSGSCLLLRREAFDSVAGFDDSYFMYFEDVDLGDRLGRAGWRNVYVPTAMVVHLHGHSTSRDSVRMLAVHHDSALRYLSGRYPGRVWKPVLAIIRSGLALRLRLASRRLRRYGELF